MAEAQILADRLVTSQNPDGGWPYRQGSSWAEPTAFALLALQSIQLSTIQPSIKRALFWLLAAQKPEGGWAPNRNVDTCTSVTSIATLVLLSFAATVPEDRLEAALRSTAKQVYTDNFSLALLLARALHLPPAHAPGSVPWYPGTAGWVTPTALTALALCKAARERTRPELHGISRSACSYLLSRRCRDGGWNHGGTSARSEDAISYPETTGLALLALRAAGLTPPPQTLALARDFVSHPASVEGLAWLQLALGTAQESIPDPSQMPTPHTTRDVALRLLSMAAHSGGNRIFLGENG